MARRALVGLVALAALTACNRHTTAAPATTTTTLSSDERFKADVARLDADPEQLLTLAHGLCADVAQTPATIANGTAVNANAVSDAAITASAQQTFISIATTNMAPAAATIFVEAAEHDLCPENAIPFGEWRRSHPG